MVLKFIFQRQKIHFFNVRDCCGSIMSEEIKFKPRKVKNLRVRKHSSDEDEDKNQEDEEFL